MYNIISILLLIIWILCFIWLIICLAKIFKKAWKSWWFSLIPFYNLYIYFKIAGKVKWFWIPLIFLIIWFITAVLNTLFELREIPNSWIINDTVEMQEATLTNQDNPSMINPYSDIKHGFFIWQLLSLIVLLSWFIFYFAFIIAWIKVSIWLSRKFWKGILFWLWILLIPPLFLWLIAFDKSKYLR